jgi:hypothetical protein
MSSPANGTISSALLALVGALACSGADVKSNAPGGAGGSHSGPTGDADASRDASDRSAGARATTGSGGYPATGGVPVFGGVIDAGETFPGCIRIVEVAELVTVPMLVLLDRSQSMSCPVAGGGDRWSAVKTAITSFVQGSGPSVGIQYFGLDGAADAGPSCNPIDYQTPDVEVGPLPENTRPIIDSLGRHGPGGQRPTATALVGAANHLVDWADAQPSTAAIVLVTDGAPDACGSAADVAHAAAVAAQKGIPTFVIGLVDSGNSCNQALHPTNQKELDAIAQSGGTRHAVIVDVHGSIDTQITDALHGVVLTGPPSCRRQLPQLPPGTVVNSKTVKVRYTYSGSMDPVVLTAVAGESACDPKEGGWYFDDDTKPTEIEICPASCDALDVRRGDVSFSIGCAD